MKAIASKKISSVRITPAIVLNHRSSKKSAVLHAAAALKTLAEQYRLKNINDRKKTGHA